MAAAKRMTDNSVENNILLNYEGFLIEQAVFFEEIKRTVHEKLYHKKNPQKFLSEGF